MSVPLIRRRLREHFGISAPRMTVRTSLPWWERGAALVVLAAIAAGLVWWAFDAGRREARVASRDLDARFTSLEGETARLGDDAVALRMRNSELESGLAMSRATEQALSRQVADLSAENARLKEELIVLRRLSDEAAKPAPARRVP
jgi:hypothetical protein